MIAFAAILFFIVAIIIKMEILIFALPILLGAVMLVAANYFLFEEFSKKIVIILWDVITVLVTFFCTKMLWSDLFDESLNYGIKPFVILIGYAVASIVFFVIWLSFLDEDWVNSFEKATTSAVNTVKQKDFRDEPCYGVPFKLVKENLCVETDLFEEYGMRLKYNLMQESGGIQFNFEIFNTKAFTEKYDNSTDILVKANIYDCDGRLVDMEERWLYYSELKQGYISDYLYFWGENVDKAFSMRVYAVIVNDEQE